MQIWIHGGKSGYEKLTRARISKREDAHKPVITINRSVMRNLQYAADMVKQLLIMQL